MAEEPTDAVPEILKRIQADVASIKNDVAGLKAGQAETTRELSDLKEAVASMIGYVQQVGLKQNRIDRDIISLHNRVTALEVQAGLTLQE